MVEISSTYDIILMIATGGTGGHMVPNLVRMISHLPFPEQPILILADKDKVELKNVQRQNFITSDIGRNKAQILAERYSAAFGVAVDFIADNMDYLAIEKFVIKNTGKILIIDTVDNIRTRCDINIVAKTYSNVDWLSVGNTDKNGQMVMYSQSVPKKFRRSLVDVFPDDFTYEEADKQDEEERTARANCAENSVINPQSIAVNIMGSTITINHLYEMYYQKQMTNDVVFYDIYNNTRGIKIGDPTFPKINDDVKDKLARKLEALSLSSGHAESK